ncbi:capsule assembly Wzi family protein [Spirosoma sp. KNUC1025]|uniref:capsule assembly Wzi family protein n=1 Tax=Spirosoma sp. KNUC1025 TaxID=2894082 RepID=UPI00386F5F50|nr:capsule assembly Wzi family protein [Spirosoma sp. KNUC1025]
MSGLRPLLFTTLLLIGYRYQAISQQLWHAEVEAGSILSNQSATPFWLRTNQYGIIPNQAPAGLFQAAVWKSYAKPDSTHLQKFDWGIKLNPVVTYDKLNHAKVLLPEAHLKVRYKAIELYVGRRREVTGLGDTTLSSGFYAVSGNALPIPKLQIGTIGYAPLHFTHDFVAINAAFAHGWFNAPYIQGIRLHQKHLYLRFGKPRSVLKIYAGVNHQVQWAGHAEFLKQRPDIADPNGYFPSDWSFYKYVVFSYTPKDWSNVAGYSYFDSYRVGNSVGSIDFGLELNTKKSRLLGYYQHAYEDVSGIVFKNLPDGLWGISYVPKPQKSASFRVNRLTLEFLTTKDQSGSTFYIQGSSYQGGDNYYNHSQYTEGWSYFGRTIGTPFIAPGQDYADSSAVKNGQFFPNNRVNMGYVGIQASYRNATFMLRTSFSKNYGTFREPPKSYPTQFSGLLTAQIPFTRWPNTYILAKAALDNGGLYTNSFGGYVGIKKSW